MDAPYIRSPLRKSIRHVHNFLQDITDDGFDLLSVYALERLLQYLSQKCAGVAVSPHGIRVVSTVIEKDSVLSFVESLSEYPFPRVTSGKCHRDTSTSEKAETKKIDGIQETENM